MTPIDVPPLDPRREQALLDAFDAHWARPRPVQSRWSSRVRTRRSYLISAATAVALAATVASLNWLVIRNRPPIDPARAETAFDMSGFVPLPGAEAWPRFESGSVVRMDFPVAALSVLGLQVQSSTGVVKADIVVGQDGVARAIRIVQ